MWLSGQQKRPASTGEGQTGIVTVGGANAAVRLDSEVRGPDLYAPAGYHWLPNVGDRVLVIKGEGERPCIVGVKQGGEPAEVTIRAGVVALQGEIFVNGISLEEYIRGLARQVVEELT